MRTPVYDVASDDMPESVRRFLGKIFASFQGFFPLPAKVIQGLFILLADVAKHVFGAHEHADFRVFLAGEIECLRHGFRMLKIEVAGNLSMIADGIGRHSGCQPFQQRGFAGAVIAREKGDRRLEFEAFQPAQRRNGKGYSSLRSGVSFMVTLSRNSIFNPLYRCFFFCVSVSGGRGVYYIGVYYKYQNHICVFLQ